MARRHKKELPLQDFTALGLAAPITNALARHDFLQPTPIQAGAIPNILAGRDLLGIAQTGTGKTAAFALPILHHLVTRPRRMERGRCRVLVISPTRELASQIGETFRSFAEKLPISVAIVFGGVSHGAQIKALSRGLDILVATPGRLVDHLDTGVARLCGTEFFVLDEVDQMLDLGFAKSIRRIVGELPNRRQNLFFSATMPNEIAKLANDLLRDPVEVSVTPVAKTADRVSQQVLFVETHRKRDLLVELFGDTQMSRAIVFTRTKHGADKVMRHLESAGVAAAAIHGNKSQSQRERSLLAFRSGTIRALVATDIAARGIDIDRVTHVVNFDLPEVAEAYVHRIGRTARAGSEGIAISLCDDAERDLLRNIEKLTRLRLPSVDRRSAVSSPADNRPPPAGSFAAQKPASAGRKPHAGNRTQGTGPSKPGFATAAARTADRARISPAAQTRTGRNLAR
jgi:ATP-dependent RNA helicase RhlE